MDHPLFLMAEATRRLTREQVGEVSFPELPMDPERRLERAQVNDYLLETRTERKRPTAGRSKQEIPQRSWRLKIRLNKLRRKLREDALEAAMVGHGNGAALASYVLQKRKKPVRR
ncbi:hypothetical protein [Deinococcus roseus]|uniref:Uncharacterized protein n=1 Tax=Deinococcus roseus TaxID=392414 RepID=A0ABQ2DHJ4_9DEIO|nr:hypothetical protein [Deinococcus roseus]GGJ58359.1 hypothetical protein GCM10008938_50540 [Deinococcus roseus]